jgi:hypothetical protein
VPRLVLTSNRLTGDKDLEVGIAEPHLINAASPQKIFYAALASTLLNTNPTFFKQTKVNIRVRTTLTFLFLLIFYVRFGAGAASRYGSSSTQNDAGACGSSSASLLLGK